MSCNWLLIEDLFDQRKAKIIVLGDVGVGKTSIIERYCKGTFNKKKQSTIGVDFQSKKITLEDG